MKTYEVKTSEGTRFQFRSNKEVKYVAIGITKNTDGTRAIEVISKTSMWRISSDKFYAWKRKAYEVADNYDAIQIISPRQVSCVDELLAKTETAFAHLKSVSQTPEIASDALRDVYRLLNELQSELKARA